MDFLISAAWAQGAPANGAPQGGSGMTLFFMIAMFVVFYFLLIRPQQKRVKEHRALVAALAKGDEVVTAGGMVGRVTDLTDNYVTVEVGEGVNIKLQRQAIQTVLPKGTLKSA
jgi:preprotein translocase subunit YajC